VAELNSLHTQNTGPAGTVDSREASTHTGGLVMPHTSAIKAKSGFRPGPGTSPGLVTATGTPDGSVHVAPFQLFIQNIRGSGLGTYITALDAQKDINILTGFPADGTNPRDDLIVAQQSDIFDADANSDFLVRHVVGTPAAVPSDPAISGSTNVVALARIRIGAGVTTINSGNITDLRTTGHAKSLVGGLYSVALGGVLPVASQAQRDALTGIYSGLGVWRQDLLQLEFSDGSAFRPIGLVKIAEQILGGTTASVTFSSIPAGYSALEMHIQARGDTASSVTNINLQFNADTAANYDTQSHYGQTSSTGAVETLAGTSITIPEIAAASAPANHAGTLRLSIPRHAATTWFKSVDGTSTSSFGTGAGALVTRKISGRWRSTAAITSIKLQPAAGSFVTGSSFTLYGLP
jgi:hypothetical protein